MWLVDLPAGRTFTAERVAYRNLLEGISPPRTARIRNPFREWIGAQIRTDLYGWANPGDPLRAAEWAWRDAAVSHTRNGLYGAMFVAAMASAAIGGADIGTVLDVGTSVVPPNSRMARAVALGRDLGRSGGDPTEAYAALEAEFAGHALGAQPQQHRARRLRPGGRGRGLRPVDLPHRDGRLGHRLQRRHGGRDHGCPDRCRRHRTTVDGPAARVAW